MNWCHYYISYDIKILDSERSVEYIDFTTVSVIYFIACRNSL